MKNSILFNAFLALIIFAFGCTKDSPVDEPTGRSGKSILAVTVGNADGDFPPVIQIDSIQNVVKIYIGHNPSITDMSLMITVSPGARLENSYSDFRTPKTYTVTAEDGSTRQYTVIVSQAKFSWRINSTILPGYFDNVYKEFCNDGNNNRLTINIGCGPGPSTGFFKTYIEIILPGKTLNDNLIGAYAIGPLPGSSSSIAVVLGSGFSSQSFSNPDQGTLTITSYDNVRKLISGYISSARFNTIPPDYYFLSGDFYNIPLQ